MHICFTLHVYFFVFLRTFLGPRKGLVVFQGIGASIGHEWNDVDRYGKQCAECSLLFRFAVCCPAVLLCLLCTTH
jgi:hypothetical protein